MKFTQDTLDQGYAITGYEPGSLKVRQTEYRESLLLTPEQIIGNWSVSDMSHLVAEDLIRLMEYAPDIIIFGTGETQVFPHPRVLAPLMQQGIGYEIMNTAAACRTYNVLLSEERRVLAALIP